MRKARFQKQLTIAISPEDFHVIKQITDEQEISLAQWVREAVNEALQTNKREEDTM